MQSVTTLGWGRGIILWTVAKSGKDEVRSEARSGYRRLRRDGLWSGAKLGRLGWRESKGTLVVSK